MLWERDCLSEVFRFLVTWYTRSFGRRRYVFGPASAALAKSAISVAPGEIDVLLIKLTPVFDGFSGKIRRFAFTRLVATLFSRASRMARRSHGNRKVSASWTAQGVTREIRCPPTLLSVQISTSMLVFFRRCRGRSFCNFSDINLNTAVQFLSFTRGVP